MPVEKSTKVKAGIESTNSWFYEILQKPKVTLATPFLGLGQVTNVTPWEVYMLDSPTEDLFSGSTNHSWHWWLPLAATLVEWGKGTQEGVAKGFLQFIHAGPTEVQRRKRYTQGGNSNLDCVPRTAIVAMSDLGGGGEGGSLVPTLSTRCATRGGGGSLVPTLSTRCATRGGGHKPPFSQNLASYISVIKCVIAFKFSQCAGHT